MTCDEISPGGCGSTSVAPEVENKNRKTVKMLYKALRHGDREKVTKLVGPNLEWWYHGLPNCHYMMKMLTGESTHTAFKFRPRRIRTVGERVIVEGWEGAGAYWVHVWGLGHGIIAQFREYFNTLLTVVLRVSGNGKETRLWQSMNRARVNGSLPDLVLVI
ncbi:senescence associated gene 20-like [Prosopis cineraria]|uniref:senescence associated gene 20-like n=1 Tax=Prosopis cineraria TaxID=364024 RepID=UPI00241027FF|nr:senescence associated gene 20-like [Prosopis cineraria]